MFGKSYRITFFVVTKDINKHGYKITVATKKMWMDGIGIKPARENRSKNVENFNSPMKCRKREGGEANEKISVNRKQKN